MKLAAKIAGLALPGLLLGGLCSAPVRAQAPAVVAPVVINTAAPIVVGAVKQKNTGLGKLEGYVRMANTQQITVWAKGNEAAIQTFTLSQEMSAKMQTIVDRGGYQYGDKVTIYYDPSTLKAVKINGKPSKPI
jgi:hypothetical protein